MDGWIDKKIDNRQKNHENTELYYVNRFNQIYINYRQIDREIYKQIDKKKYQIDRQIIDRRITKIQNCIMLTDLIRFIDIDIAIQIVRQNDRQIDIQIQGVH